MAVRSTNNNVIYDEVEGVMVRKTMANFFGSSTDTKPTTNIVNGSFFMEVDTGDIYAFDEDSSEWVAVGSSSSGGGDIPK